MNFKNRLLSIDSQNDFGIISGWHQEKPFEVNELSHQQLKTNLRNLGYGFIELNCTFQLSNSEGPGDERTLFIPEVGLYELLLLGIRYGQAAVLFKDKQRFELLDTSVGRVLSSFSIDCSDLEAAYSKYLQFRTTYDIIALTFEELYIPTLADSLRKKQAGSGLATTKWVKLFK